MSDKLVYTNFNEYFKVIAPHLWLIKEWDNETIKAWLENAFEDARKTIKDPKDTR
jgi:hypothetical protein